jgi:hypothetical protein
MKKTFIICSLVFFMFTSKIQAKIGNFSLPPSQSPGPLLSFGQMLIPPKTFQWQQSFERLNSNITKAGMISQTLIVGVTDIFSIAATTPYFVDLSEEGNHSKGLSDFILDLEMSIFSSKINNNGEQETTLFGSLSLPGGSNQNDPPTSLGVRSYFVGATYHRMYPYWYWFLSVGGHHFEKKQTHRHADEILYQAGVGKNLAHKSKNILMALLELNGLHIIKTRTVSIFDKEPGGIIINITPSFSYANPYINLQLGYSIPLFQHWNNINFKSNGLALLVLTWTFYNQ